MRFPFLHSYSTNIRVHKGVRVRGYTPNDLTKILLTPHPGKCWSWCTPYEIIITWKYYGQVNYSKVLESTMANLQFQTFEASFFFSNIRHLSTLKRLGIFHQRLNVVANSLTHLNVQIVFFSAEIPKPFLFFAVAETCDNVINGFTSQLKRATTKEDHFFSLVYFCRSQ